MQALAGLWDRPLPGLSLARADRRDPLSVAMADQMLSCSCHEFGRPREVQEDLPERCRDLRGLTDVELARIADPEPGAVGCKPLDDH